MDPQYKVVDGNIGAGRFLFGDYDPNRSSEQVTLAITAVVIPEGSYMGKVTRGAQTVAAPVAGAGNVGNGTFLAQPTADANIAPGDYHVEIVEDVANAGRFLVRNPDGTEEHGNVAAAFNGQLNFTLQDGATDFVAGDNFVITVSYPNPSGQWKPVDPAAHDGTQFCAGLLYARAGISTAVQRGVIVARHALVNGNLLNAVVALNGGQVAAAEAQLATLGIIVRR